MRNPLHNIQDGDLPIHKNDNTHFVIALPDDNRLRTEFAYEYLDVYIHFDGRVDVRPRFRSETASPHDKKTGHDWNYPSNRITDLTEIPVETRREIQQTWERYLDKLDQVRDLAINPSVHD